MITLLLVMTWLLRVGLYLLLGLFVVIPIEVPDLRARRFRELTSQEACSLVWLWLGWPIAASMIVILCAVMAVCALLDLLPTLVLQPAVAVGHRLHRLAYRIANRGRA